MPYRPKYPTIKNNASQPSKQNILPNIAPIKGLYKALLVGNNYSGTPYELSGCVNDVLQMSTHLKKYYPMCKEHRIISDVEVLKPTRQTILDGFAWLTEGLKSGMNVYFHYSGHGGRVKDKNGDEVSMLDSCIYGVQNGIMQEITDDEIRTYLANKIPEGCKCFIVLDACHSGSAVDLRCSWQVPSEYSLIYNELPHISKTTGTVVLLSGCVDEQTASDTVNDVGIPCGALTWALLETWKSYSTQIKLKYVLWDIHTFLRTKGYTQKPQLTMGNYMDVNSIFDLNQ